VGSGSVAKNPDQTNYAHGTIVTLTATPASGWTFSGWSGALTGSTNPTTITMDAAKTVTATFTQITYTLTMAVSPGGSGTTTPAVGGHSYASGTSVPITATAATGYHFVNWTVSGGTGVANPTNASTTVSVDQNKTVTANFEQHT